MREIIARIIVFFSFFLGLSFSFSGGSMAAPATHLVISEIQTAGGTANDEFIELYNPTSSAVDISGWSIQYRGGAATTYSKKNFVSGNLIPGYGFFLIARTEYDGSPAADMSHSTFALSAQGGTVFLVNNQTLLTEATDGGSTVVDKLAYGTGTAGYLRPEGTEFTTAPTVHQSLERKAKSSSTADSLVSGGQDALLGNGEDTDNNANDFILRTTSEPQNTASLTEEPASPTPTPTPTLTPTPSPTPTPTPTLTPTSTPTPTPTPTSSSTTTSSSTSSDSGGGSASAPVCSDTKPGSAPTLLSATPGVNQVTLTWSAASGPVSYYLVAYGTSSGNYTFGNPNVGGKETTSYQVAGLSGEITYYFKVRAGNGCMPGDYSNEIAATPSGLALSTVVPAGFAPGVLGTEAEKGEIKGGATEAAPQLEEVAHGGGNHKVLLGLGLFLFAACGYFLYRRRFFLTPL